MRDSLFIAKDRILNLMKDNSISMDERVHAEPLGVEEAIGDPSPYKDFPLLGGVEKLVDVTFRSFRGQAFSSSPCRWSGTLAEVFSLSLGVEKNRTIVIAAINALAREMGISEGTIHCRDKEPHECGKQMARGLAREFGNNSVVGIAGYNPAIISNVVDAFGPERVRVTDLNPANVGHIRYGAHIWHGKRDLEKLASECTVALVTGSALCNGTLDEVLEVLDSYNRPVIFFGTTIAGIADLLGYRRWCFKSC
jgi:hypothetical protein